MNQILLFCGRGFFFLHSTLFSISFGCAAQQLDIHIGYRMFLPMIQVPTWRNSYYSTVNHIPYAPPYIPVPIL